MASTVQTTLVATKGARVYGSGGGAGASLYLPWGLWSGDVYRALLQFANPDYTALKARQLTKAVLRLKNSTQFYVGRGGSPRCYVRRITESWSEGSSSTLSSSNAVTWANQPVSTTTGQVDSGTLPTSDGATVDIDITTLFGYLLPTTVKRADGSAGGGFTNYGFKLLAYDEGSTSRTSEVYSDDYGTTGSRPTLILTFVTNAPPTAPSLTSPIADTEGNAGIAAIVGGSITFAGTRNDPDTGDYVTGVEVAIYADATTNDAAPGTPVASKQFAVTGSPTSFSVAMPTTGLAIGTTYRAKVRTEDREGAWGAWSLLATSRFIPDTPPAAPSNLSQDANTQTPNFYGSLVDPDAGATISEVRIVVEQATTSGTVQKWDSGWVSSGGTRFSVGYGGSTLDFGTAYRWYAQVRDNVGAMSPVSPTVTWTPTQLTGPTAMSPINVETKQNSLTPTLTVGNGGAFTNHRVEVAKYADGTSLVWQPAPGAAYTSTTSKAVTYAGQALTWGRIFYWRAQVFVGGTTWSDWSPWYPFYVNAQPDAPTGSVDNAGPVATGVFGEYVTVPTTTPTLRFPFSDPDVAKGYTDAPTRREIEIRRADTAAAVTGSPFVITSSIGATYTVGSGVLTSGVIYQARARYDDGAGVRSPWSEWVTFKVSTPLTIAAGAAVDPADPTPALAWTLNRGQRAYRAQISDVLTGELVWDSGLVLTATTSAVVPGYVLDTDHTYRWTVTAYDADMLSATLT